MCEACGKSPAKGDDILCAECNHYYMILLDLLAEDPESLDRLKEICEWRMKKIQAVSA